MTFALYTREDCDLCRVAENLLDGLGYPYRTIDIDRDLALIQRFGARVPVLVETTADVELAWPFTAQDIDQVKNA